MQIQFKTYKNKLETGFSLFLNKLTTIFKITWKIKHTHFNYSSKFFKGNLFKIFINLI